MSYTQKYITNILHADHSHNNNNTLVQFCSLPAVNNKKKKKVKNYKIRNCMKNTKGISEVDGIGCQNESDWEG